MSAAAAEQIASLVYGANPVDVHRPPAVEVGFELR
jgi:hypothetical protein